MDVIAKLFVVSVVGCAVALFDVLPLWRVGVAGALLAVALVGVSMVQRTRARQTLAYHCATSIAVFVAISASMIGHPAFPQMTGMALVAAVASIAMHQWIQLADGFDLVTALRSERFDKLSQMSMNKIAPCQSCEMRYLCSDCRYLEMATGASAEECVRCHRVS